MKMTIRIGDSGLPFFSFLIFFVVACNSVNKGDIENSLNQNKLTSETIDHSFDTSFINNGLNFHVSTKDIKGDFILLTATDNTRPVLIDTIDSPGFAYIAFPDFNKDGNTDILLDYIGNNSTYYLYLFDTATNEFKNIPGYYSFPGALQLKSNPKYYYSYHRAGCADLNWVSDLFMIVDFEIIHLGHIYGQGCDSEVKENPQAIEIYNVIDNNENQKILIEKLPYLKFIGEFEDKWNYIEKYWNENYAKFD